MLHWQWPTGKDLPGPAGRGPRRGKLWVESHSDIKQSGFGTASAGSRILCVYKTFSRKVPEGGGAWRGREASQQSLPFASSLQGVAQPS